jgi:P4 family phage/plasmid primase-like protien
VSLADEVLSRTPSKWYVCPRCKETHESKKFLDKCPACMWEGELTEAITKDSANIIATAPEKKKVGVPVDEETELLNKAYAHYVAKEMPAGDQAAAQWLIKSRNVKTDINGRIYAYNPSKGHYEVSGDVVLKSDLAQAFKSLANRTRVGEVLAKVQALSYCDEELLEKTIPPNLIPLENGVYDLVSKQLLQHSPEYFFTYKHPVVYDATALCPIVHKFLSEIVATVHDKEILFDIGALCLYRSRVTRKFFIFTGGGHNGKSKSLALYRAVLGKNRVVSMTPQALAEDVFAPAQLYDKHANLGADIPGGVLKDTAIVKNATGGDAINVQRKGVDRVDREVYCEFVWASNTPPILTEDTNAIWDRVVTIKFPYIFVEKPTLPFEKLSVSNIEEQITAPGELSGFLNELLKRLPSLLERRDLSVEVKPADVRREYRIISDTPSVFVEECCAEVQYEPSDGHIPADGYVAAADAYKAYKSWCKDNHSTPVSANRFGRAMEYLGYERGKDNQQRSYRGLKIKNDRNDRNDSSPSEESEEQQTIIEDAFRETPSRLQTIKKLIVELEKELGAQFPADDLIGEAVKEGMNETEVQEVIQMLVRGGDLYSVKPGFIGRRV